MEKKSKTHQRTRRIERIGQYHSDEAGVDVARHDGSNSQDGGEENDDRTDEFQTDGKPSVDSDAGKVAHLVAIDPKFVLCSKDGLLVVGPDGRQSGQRLGKPGKDGRLRDGVEPLQFTGGREVVTEGNGDQRQVRNKLVDLRSHPIVEPCERNDGKKERRETEADNQKNGCCGSGGPDQALDDLVAR